MAKYFKDLSGIDPVTIDQVDMTEHSKSDLEFMEYKQVSSYFNFSEPIFLKSNTTATLWSADKSSYDIQLFSPRSGTENRPIWLKKLKGRKSYNVTSGNCQTFPCLIQAFLKHEYALDAIPVDQVLFRSEGENQLFLPKGDYIIVTNRDQALEISIR